MELATTAKRQSRTASEASSIREVIIQQQRKRQKLGLSEATQINIAKKKAQFRLSNQPRQFDVNTSSYKAPTILRSKYRIAPDNAAAPGLQDAAKRQLPSEALAADFQLRPERVDSLLFGSTLSSKTSNAVGTSLKELSQAFRYKTEPTLTSKEATQLAEQTAENAMEQSRHRPIIPSLYGTGTVRENLATVATKALNLHGPGLGRKAYLSAGMVDQPKARNGLVSNPATSAALAAYQSAKAENHSTRMR